MSRRNFWSSESLKCITKVTGHSANPADLRYLDERESRGNWKFCPLTQEEIRSLINKNRRIFMAEESGPIIRFPAQTVFVRDRNGVTRRRRTGLISEAYASQLQELLRHGKRIFQRVVVGVKPLEFNHGFHLAREHGAVVPLTYKAIVNAKELGYEDGLESVTVRKILGRVLRESIKSNTLIRRAVKSIGSNKKAGRIITAHNLVVAPHPNLLQQIRNTGQAVDKLLETAARRALEKLERRIGAKLIAVCSTHLQDSSGVRPHLHIRMSAYDSNGKYVRLFDRKAGSAGSNRCLLQPEIERELLRTIERLEPRGRD